jgi:chromosome segregation ATPase
MTKRQKPKDEIIEDQLEKIEDLAGLLVDEQTTNKHLLNKIASADHELAEVRERERDAIVRAGAMAAQYDSLKKSAEHTDDLLSESNAALSESRKHFGEMKQQLLESEKTIARLQGYVDRVKEDDNARDGFDVVEQKREVVLPRRHPDAGSSLSVLPDAAGGTYRSMATVRPKRHWTDY